MPDTQWVPVPSKRAALEWAEWVAHELKPGIPAAALAFRLASYWNEETGDAWPGLDRLALDLSASTRTVTTAVERLESLDVILVDRHPRRSNRYILLRPTLLMLPVDDVPIPPVGVEGASTQGGRSFDPDLHQVRPWVEAAATDPLGIPQFIQETKNAGAPAAGAARSRCAEHPHEHVSAYGCRACLADQKAGVR
jgi:hypothetical protein